MIDSKKVSGLTLLVALVCSAAPLTAANAADSSKVEPAGKMTSLADCACAEPNVVRRPK